MGNQQDHQGRNPGAADQDEFPPRDRSNIDDVPEDGGNRDVRQDRTIGDPRIIEERQTPGAENAEDELDDEDFEAAPQAERRAASRP